MLTVGEILHSERQKKGLKLADIEKKIRVREKFLRELEKDNWELFSSKVYIEGVIKNYAKVLGLNQEKVLAFFRREYARKEELGFRSKLSSKYLTPETKKYLYLLVAGVFLLFVVYFGFQLKQFLAAPKVEILSPKTQAFKREEQIEIVGKTQKEAVVTIFNTRVYQNNEGIFSYEFPLKPGRNELVIEVVGANGKKTVFKREYFVNP